MDTRISFLSFIGSAKVGWKLKSMMPPGCMCALEHGGVAPVVIDKDYNYQNDLYKILRGAFYHAGQVCVSIQNIFVNKKIINNFSEEIVANAKKLKVGDPLLIETDVGPLIRNQEVNRVEKMVDETLSSKMGELLLGGKRISNSLFECTILRDTDPNSKVFKNEIFGPVINILEYDEMDDVINLINQSQFGFQSSLFSNNIHNIFYFYEKVQAKTVLINEQTAFRVDWMPFGGIKNSGEGEGGIFYSYEDMLYNKLLIIDKS
jgi:acyl-CoA reductase-like NAD-dependent aldehyde dehydrogenase